MLLIRLQVVELGGELVLLLALLKLELLVLIKMRLLALLLPLQLMLHLLLKAINHFGGNSSQIKLARSCFISTIRGGA